MVCVPLKCTCIPLLLHVFLNLFHSPCMCGTIMEMFLLLMLLLVPLLLLLLLGWLFLSSVPLLVLCLQSHFCFSLLSVHVEKWQACRVLLMCCYSLFRVCGLVDTTLALSANMLKTMCLGLKWLLSQCQY